MSFHAFSHGLEDSIQPVFHNFPDFLMPAGVIEPMPGKGFEKKPRSPGVGGAKHPQDVYPRKPRERGS
ncbi:MAG: hypothetical protein ACRYGL_14585 [Janthinobacterium lividum]